MCGEVKPCTFDTATSGFYMYKSKGLYANWDGMCSTCKNKQRYQFKLQTRERGMRRGRLPRQDMEAVRADRRARHAERMASDPEYAKRRRDRQTAGRRQREKNDRIPARPLIEILRIVRVSRFDNDLQFMSEVLEYPPRWLGELMREKWKTVSVGEADDLLAKLDWDVTFTQLYPLDKPTRVR